MPAKGFKLLDAYVAVHGDGTGVVPDTVKQMEADTPQVTAGGRSFGASLVGGIHDALLGGIKVVGTALVGVTAAGTALGVSFFKDAARVQELDIAMAAVAKSTGYSYDEMLKNSAAVKANGIETATAQTITIQFAQNHLKLADAIKVSRTAQDLAVITGQNSTDVTNQLLDAITSQNTEILRNAGITTSAAEMYDVYAKSIGTTAAALTDAQKKQALVNGIIADGAKVAGTYEKAMGSASKVLRSLPRIGNDIAVSLGSALVNALGQDIVKFYDLAKAVDMAVQKGGPLYPIIDLIGQKLSKVLAPIGNWIDRATTWVDGLTITNDQLDKLSGWIDKLIENGPAILSVFSGLLAVGGANIPIIGGLLGRINPLVAALVTLGLTDPVLRIEIKELLGDAGDALKALKPVFDMLVKLTKVVIPGAEQALKGFTAGLDQKSAPKASDTLAWLNDIGYYLGQLTDFYRGSIQEMWDTLQGKDVDTKAAAGDYGVWIKAIQDFGGMLGDFVKSAIGVIQDFLSNTAGMFQDWATNTLGMFHDWAANTSGMLYDFFDHTVGMFHDFFTNTVGMFSDFGVKVAGVWNGLWGGLGRAVSGAFEGALGGVRGALNAIISLINGAIAGIDRIKFTVPSWVPIVGGQSWGGLGVPKIPLLAGGGTLTRPGQVIVGEKGAELLNLPAGASVSSHTDTQKILQQSGSGDVSIHIDKVELNAEDFKDVQTAMDTLRTLAQTARKGKGGTS
jgi:hypothetical protein